MLALIAITLVQYFMRFLASETGEWWRSRKLVNISDDLKKAIEAERRAQAFWRYFKKYTKNRDFQKQLALLSDDHRVPNNVIRYFNKKIYFKDGNIQLSSLNFLDHLKYRSIQLTALVSILLMSALTL